MCLLQRESVLQQRETTMPSQIATRTYSGTGHIGNLWMLTFGFDLIILRLCVYACNFQNLQRKAQGKKQ
jgi:hypothetical protein